MSTLATVKGVPRGAGLVTVKGAGLTPAQRAVTILALRTFLTGGAPYPEETTLDYFARDYTARCEAKALRLEYGLGPTGRERLSLRAALRKLEVPHA